MSKVDAATTAASLIASGFSLNQVTGQTGQIQVNNLVTNTLDAYSDVVGYVAIATGHSPVGIAISLGSSLVGGAVSLSTTLGETAHTGVLSWGGAVTIAQQGFLGAGTTIGGLAGLAGFGFGSIAGAAVGRTAASALMSDAFAKITGISFFNNLVEDKAISLFATYNPAMSLNPYGPLGNKRGGSVCLTGFSVS